MKLDKEEEKLLRQLEVLRRFVKNVEEKKQTIKKGIEGIEPSQYHISPSKPFFGVYMRARTWF